TSLAGKDIRCSHRRPRSDRFADRYLQEAVEQGHRPGGEEQARTARITAHVAHQVAGAQCYFCAVADSATAINPTQRPCATPCSMALRKCMPAYIREAAASSDAAAKLRKRFGPQPRSLWVRSSNAVSRP